MIKVIAVLLLSTVPVLSFAQVYKCEVGGKTTFSDEPCGPSSQRIHVDALPKSGMRLDRGTKQSTYTPTQSSTPSRKAAPDPCPYINSTDLKALIIREKVKTGMKPADVEKSWGAPSSIRKSSSQTQWAYHWPNGNSNYVYFEHGCVSDFSSYQRNY